MLINPFKAGLKKANRELITVYFEYMLVNYKPSEKGGGRVGFMICVNNYYHPNF